MIFLQDIPKDYVYCFAGKDTCPKAGTCLRAIAAKLLTESQEPQPHSLNTVNALYLEQLPDSSLCTLYRSNEPVRYAKGMTQLFEELPLKQAHAVRLSVMRCFSCESIFYHSRKGARLISPQEQQAIIKVFRSTGLDITPKFDEFEYIIEW